MAVSGSMGSGVEAGIALGEIGLGKPAAAAMEVIGAAAGEPAQAVDLVDPFDDQAHAAETREGLGGHGDDGVLAESLGFEDDRWLEMIRIAATSSGSIWKGCERATRGSRGGGVDSGVRRLERGAGGHDALRAVRQRCGRSTLWLETREGCWRGDLIYLVT